MTLSSRSRKKIRYKANLKLYRRLVNDLTALDVNRQMESESDYLFIENRELYLLLTKGDVILLDIKEEDFRILGRLACKLSKRHQKDIVIMPFEDLMKGYEHYLNNPPKPKVNQLSLERQHQIVDMALACLTWSCAHIASEMNKLGFDEVRDYHVQNLLSRNYIPTSWNRMRKGFPWATFVEILKWQNSTKAYPYDDAKSLKSNPHYKMHKRLSDFIDNIKLDPELVARNLYARLENDILREMCNRNHISISSEVKHKLAMELKKVEGFTRDMISLLSPWQVTNYFDRVSAERHTSHLKTKRESKPSKKEKITDLRKIADEHPNWEKKQIRKAMAEKYKGITDHEINDLLRDMGHWVAKRTKGGVQWLSFVDKIGHVTWAGDFFCVEVFTERGPKTFYVLFFIHLETDLLFLGGISSSASSEWLKNTLKRWTEDGKNPFGPDAKFLIRDRDRRYTKDVDWCIAQLGMMPIKISPGVPVMNCYAERMVNRFRSECLQYLSFSDEHNLHVVLENFVWYYNNQRPNRKHGGRCIVDDESYGQTEGEIERVDLIPGIVIYFRRVPRKRGACFF